MNYFLQIDRMLDRQIERTSIFIGSYEIYKYS